MEENNIVEKISKVFDLFVQLIFGVKVEFKVDKHRTIDNGYVIILPRKGEGINHLVGRGGQTLNSLNRIFSAWAFRNKVIVFIKQSKTDEEKEQTNN
jgi:predicted RNA-binding protein Jag